MSWTCSIPEVDPDELHDAIDEAVSDPAKLADGPAAQFSAAKHAAHALHEAGVVGQGKLPVTVRMSGHYSGDPYREGIVTVSVLELAPTIAQTLPDPPAQDAVVHGEDGELLPPEQQQHPSAPTAEQTEPEASAAGDDEAAQAAEGE